MNEPMPSVSPCLNTALHKLTDITFFTHTVHAPRSGLFTEQILSFVYATSNSLSSETLWSSGLTCALLYSEPFTTPLFYRHTCYCAYSYFFFDQSSVCWDLLDMDNTNLMPRLKGGDAEHGHPWNGQQCEKGINNKWE